MPPPSSSPEAVALEFAGAMRAPIERIVAQYAALDATDRGRIINTDFVRLLCPQYLQAPSLYSPAIHGTAAKTSFRIFQHYLEIADNMPGVRAVLFMAGGPGAGKGTTLTGLFDNENEKPKFIFDQTFSGPGAATQIQNVLGRNLDAQVLYVHRPVELATIGIISRYLDPKNGEQRTVPLDYIADRHFNSQHTFLDLLNVWTKNNDHLSLLLIDNTRYRNPAAHFLKEADAVDFLSQKNILYHNANETRTRTQRAFASVAFLLRDEIRRVFDSSEGPAQFIPPAGGTLGAKSGDELAEKPSKTRCLINRLDVLRAGHAGIPSEIIHRLFQEIRREAGSLHYAFQKAVLDYAAGVITPAQFDIACHKQARLTGQAWAQKFSQSITYRL